MTAVRMAVLTLVVWAVSDSIGGRVPPWLAWRIGYAQASSRPPVLPMGAPDWVGNTRVQGRLYRCGLWMFPGGAFVQACYPLKKGS